MRKIILGFISGVIFVLVIIGNMTMEDLEKMTSSYHKKKFIDKIEYLLLGYNTIKTRPYTSYNGKSYKSYRSSHTTSFADYYPNKIFEEDEMKGEAKYEK